MTDTILLAGNYGVQNLALTDTLIVSRDALVTSTLGAAINATVGSTDVRVLGQVLAADENAIHAVGFALKVSIAAGGIVENALSGLTVPIAAISMFATDDVSVFSNAGLVSGSQLGVAFATVASVPITAFNSGTIEAGGYGVVLDGAVILDLNNSGTIAGTYVGITNEFLDGTNLVFGTGALHLTNSGNITGTFYAVNTGNAADVIVNRGTLTGNVTLGGGADIYDGTEGRVFGTVFGEVGNDTFFAGAKVDVFYGGSQVDTLDVRAGLGLTIALDQSIANTGLAAGDTYHEIENVIGSRYGNDRLIGDTGVNRLFGMGGADVLSGGAGGDVLSGGTGLDRLAGGLGNDVFNFESKAFGADVIVDFGAVAGNNDFLRLSAGGFGGGLVVGALVAAQYHSGAGHVAATSAVRFMFDATTHDLWFDADGNGAGAAILVADLQATAVFGIADILIF